MNALRRWFECRFVRSALGAYLDGELAREAARIERHLLQCGRCRALAQALAAQARAIEALAADNAAVAPSGDSPDAGFVDRVMRRIATADSHPAAQPRPQPRRRPSLALASAAAGLLVIAAAALWIAVFRSSHLPPVVAPPAPSQVAKLPPGGPAPVTTREEPQVPLPPAGAVAPTAKPNPPRPTVRSPRQSATARGPSSPVETTAGEALRNSGRSYEDQGMLDQALREYAAAEREGGSQMARLDAARVYEKTGRTAEAIDELTAVAFADLDENRWEPLSVN
jgi:hypothetical protein